MLIPEWQASRKRITWLAGEVRKRSKMVLILSSVAQAITDFHQAALQR
jgi:hypothetical protein